MKIHAKQGLLFPALLFCLWGSSPTQSRADVSVNIGLFAPPPPLVIAGPPMVALIPGTTYVYFVPGLSVDIFFYGGYWYRPHEGHWFRARTYRGPWNYVEHRALSPVLLSLPPHYRNIPPGHRKISHGQLRKNWRRWEKEHYWDDAGKGRDTHGEPYVGSKVEQRSNRSRSRGIGRRKD